MLSLNSEGCMRFCIGLIEDSFLRRVFPYSSVSLCYVFVLTFIGLLSLLLRMYYLCESSFGM